MNNNLFTDGVFLAVGGIVGAMLTAYIQSRTSMATTLMKEQNERIKVLDSYVAELEDEIRILKQRK